MNEFPDLDILGCIYCSSHYVGQVSGMYYTVAIPKHEVSFNLVSFLR